MKTIDYYERNADSFVTATIDVRFQDMQNRFVSFLPDGAYMWSLLSDFLA